MEKEKMNLTLIVDKRSGQILYAEAGKDFIDLLYSFLRMPMASVVKLLSTPPVVKVGSMNNLYESIEKLPSVCTNSVCSNSVTPMSINKVVDSSGCHKILGIGYAPNGCYSFVKEGVPFMITDDLTISPSSTIATMALLNRMNLNDISQLEQKSVTVGPEQAVKLLRASVVSTSALNEVFSTAVSIPANEVRMNEILLPKAVMNIAKVTSVAGHQTLDSCRRGRALGSLMLVSVSSYFGNHKVRPLLWAIEMDIAFCYLQVLAKDSNSS